MIREFKGEHRFLSNFEGGVEQRYQAAKCFHASDAARILALSPGLAKRCGREVRMREDWECVKELFMQQYVVEKFKREPFRSQLLATGDEEIQEGNTWGDVFWGVDLRTGQGENRLGKLLMKVRATLRSQPAGHVCQYCNRPVQPPLSYHETAQDCVDQGATSADNLKRQEVQEAAR